MYLAKQFAANYSATIEVIPTSLPSDCQQVLQCFDYKISLAKVGFKDKNGLKIHRNELEILFNQNLSYISKNYVSVTLFESIQY